MARTLLSCGLQQVEWVLFRDYYRGCLGCMVVYLVWAAFWILNLSFSPKSLSSAWCSCWCVPWTRSPDNFTVGLCPFSSGLCLQREGWFWSLLFEILLFSTPLLSKLFEHTGVLLLTFVLWVAWTHTMGNMTFPFNSLETWDTAQV